MASWRRRRAGRARFELVPQRGTHQVVEDQCRPMLLSQTVDERQLAEGAS